MIVSASTGRLTRQAGQGVVCKSEVLLSFFFSSSFTRSMSALHFGLKFSSLSATYFLEAIDYSFPSVLSNLLFKLSCTIHSFSKNIYLRSSCITMHIPVLCNTSSTKINNNLESANEINF